MNYYDELGLPPEASVPEIRRAYKVLARLVHPDGHPDEQVRCMAERQMKRLNEILATLTDTSRRHDYDLTLADPNAAVAVSVRPPTVAVLHRRRPLRFRPQPAPWRSRLPGWAQVALVHWFWIVLAALILAVGWWYVATGNTMQRTAVIQPREAASAKEAVLSFLLKPLLSSMPSFTANWLYLSGIGDTTALGSYPATYSELALAELSGSYRSRGKTPPGESATLSWTAS